MNTVDQKLPIALDLDAARDALAPPAQAVTPKPLKTLAAWSAALAGFAALGLCVLLLAPSNSNRADSPAPVVTTPNVGDILTPEAAVRAPVLTGQHASLELQSHSQAHNQSQNQGRIVEPTPASFARQEPRVTPVSLERRPQLAIVIDDVGLSSEAIQRVLALKPPVSVSVLPYAPDARALARSVTNAGHELFVHLPMEPQGLDDPGPAVLATWQPADDIRRRASAAFDLLEGASGFNNHMGSRFTTCAACLEPVMQEAERRGLAALDSLTHQHSQLAATARRSGLPALSRDVFLDHEREPGALWSALAQTELLAAEQGYAVLIAHPHAESLDALERWMPSLEARGFAVVGAADLARRLAGERERRA